MARKPRSSETRENASRSAESRKSPPSAHTSRFYIPPHVIPKGFTYAWVAVAHDSAGTQNADNWRNKYRNGWRPVPRDRHPELFPSVPNVGFGDDTDDLIKEGGQILCEKPTKDVEEDRKALAKRSRDQEKGVSWMQQQGANPFAQTMPGFDKSQTTFKHEAEFKE